MAQPLVVDEAVRQARSQGFHIEVPSDQHQAVGAGQTALIFLERETLADEMEDVALAGFGQPQESLAAEQARRAAGIEKRLEPADREWPVALEGQRDEAVTAQMSMIVPPVRGSEQIDVEDQGKRNGASRRAHKPRLPH